MQQFDPSRPDFTPYGFTCVRWRPSSMRRADHHNEIELNLLYSGWVTYLLGARRVRFEVGRLGLFWAAIPHRIVDFAPNTEYFVATIPLAWFLQCEFPKRLTNLLMSGEMAMEATSRRVMADTALFAEWESDLATGQEVARDIVMLELEARLRRLAGGLPASPGPKKSKHPSSLLAGSISKIEQMACLVAQRYVEPLTVAEISEAVGLHPNYAMKLFKDTLGTTLIAYLTRHRISHAQRLLATTDQKVVDIALQSGFNSLSRFNEAFRLACGCTPRDYRVAHSMVESDG